MLPYMPHPLFGFRQKGGQITINKREVAIVRAVLTAIPGSPVTIARMSPLDTYKAMACRVSRIRKHTLAYRYGVPMIGFPPNRRLAKLVLHGV